LIRHYSELPYIYGAHPHERCGRGFFIAPINGHGLNREPARNRQMSSNTEVITMTYEVEKSTEHDGGYSVVAVNEAAHGEKLITQFFGPDAKRRAEEYAKWKNQEQEITGEQLSAR
jgi:hypothetical protein